MGEMVGPQVVRVEFEYADGSIKKLTGDSAVTWLEDVCNVLAAAQLRYGRSQIAEYPWVWTNKADETRHVS